MAFESARVSVAQTAVLLVSGNDYKFSVRNRGTAAVYLGDATVTSATGYQLDAGEAVGLQVNPTDALYAIAATGTQTVHVLKVGA